MGAEYPILDMLESERAQIAKKGGLPKERAEFLLQPGNMKGKYLGACLDGCRWGSQTTVMYEMSIKGMIDFIQNWMQQNEDDFPELFHGMQDDYKDLELPHINHKICPKDRSHKGTVMDLGGRLRCAHTGEIRLRPSFVDQYNTFDVHAQMMRTEYLESPPIRRDSKKFGQYEQEEKTFVVHDACLAIISDQQRVLSLETIIRRKNLRPELVREYCHYTGPCKRMDESSEWHRESTKLTGMCPGHDETNDKVEFHFDGWKLALYVMRWWRQTSDGSAPLFGK